MVPFPNKWLQKIKLDSEKKLSSDCKPLTTLN